MSSSIGHNASCAQQHHPVYKKKIIVFNGGDEGLFEADASAGVDRLRGWEVRGGGGSA